MKIPTYLAMTAAEFEVCRERPAHTAWMACHFSPYGTGLTGFPDVLPEDALIIVNDRIPICGHDSKLIAVQLQDLIRRFRPRGILLDFQAAPCDELQALADSLAETLPCPVCLPEAYAKGRDCPVFVSSPPVYKPLAEQLAPWKGRQIWLEAAPEALQITVTEAGAAFKSFPTAPAQEGYSDQDLFCHYATEVSDDAVSFTLWRRKEDLPPMLSAAEQLGVTLAVGLWQELH